MAEWPADLLSGADAARPLGPEIRARVEDVLLDAEVLEPRPLDAAVDQRLEAALGDPVAVAMAGIDGPRTLPAGTHGALLENLGRRRRHLVPLVSAAAGLVVLAGVGALLATSTDRTPTPTRSAAHALGTAPGAVPRAGTTNGSSASSSNAGPPYNASSGASATGGGAGAGSGAASQGQATSTAAPVAAPDLPVVSGLTPDRGPRSGGTWVTIEGSGFTGTTVVRFGSHAARFVVLSDSRLRAEAPAGAAGSVDVEVTTPPGTSVPSPSGRYSYQ